MTDNLKKFLGAVGGDPVLIEKAKQLKADDPEAAKAAAIAFAKENGFELSMDDFVETEGELSESELTTVAGGGACACVVGGGGTDGGNDQTCVCVVAGEGEYRIDHEDSRPGVTSYETGSRCFCVGAGGGSSKN